MKEGHEGHFITTSENNLTVSSKPEAIYPNMYKVVRGGKVLGTVDATFDFSKLPPEQHALILRILESLGTTLHVAI